MTNDEDLNTKWTTKNIKKNYNMTNLDKTVPIFIFWKQHLNQILPTFFSTYRPLLKTQRQHSLTSSTRKEQVSTTKRQGLHEKSVYKFLPWNEKFWKLSTVNTSRFGVSILSLQIQPCLDFWWNSLLKKTLPNIYARRIRFPILKLQKRWHQFLVNRFFLMK